MLRAHAHDSTRDPRMPSSRRAQRRLRLQANPRSDFDSRLPAAPPLMDGPADNQGHARGLLGWGSAFGFGSSGDGGGDESSSSSKGSSASGAPSGPPIMSKAELSELLESPEFGPRLRLAVALDTRLYEASCELFVQQWDVFERQTSSGEEPETGSHDGEDATANTEGGRSSRSLKRRSRPTPKYDGRSETLPIPPRSPRGPGPIGPMVLMPGRGGA